MEYSNAYELKASKETGVLDLYKNGVPTKCKLVSPIPIESKIQTGESKYYFQFFTCNTACPNCNVEQKKDDKENTIDIVKITCGAGYAGLVTFEKQTEETETPILKIQK